MFSNATCYECGHSVNKRRMTVIPVKNGSDRRFCSSCRPKYDMVTQHTYAGDDYFLKVECRQDGEPHRWDMRVVSRREFDALQERYETMVHRLNNRIVELESSPAAKRKVSH